MLTNEMERIIMSENNNDDLLMAFGRLFQHHRFVGAAMQSCQPETPAADRRGPARLLPLWADKAELTNADIAEALDIKPSSVTALVKQLEDVGIVERHPSADDGRVMLISLTAAGKKRVDAAANWQQTASDHLFNGLSPAEQQQLVALLNKLTETLPAEEDAPDWQPPFNQGARWGQGRQAGPAQWSQRGGRRGPFDGFPFSQEEGK